MRFYRPFALERYFARYEFSVRHLLSSSDSETLTTRELLALEPGSEEGYLGLRLGYTESRGDPGLRAGISGLYEGIRPDSILVHAGAEEAVRDFCFAVLEAGDHVVVNYPCYQSLAEVPRALGCAVDPWPLRETAIGGRRRWAWDLDALARLLESRTRLVVLNAPHNPTGALPTREEFDAIVGLCRRAGAILFSDEVYRCLELDPERRLPAACEAYEDAVSLGVLSKSAGLPGLRIGWLATRRDDILDAAVSAKDYGTICGSGPSEYLAGVAVRHWDAIVARNGAIARSNLGLARSFFERRPGFASWTEPEGGSIGFPLLERTERWADAEALSRRLASEAGIMILPGSCYSLGLRTGDEDSRFRLGIGRASFSDALAALEAWLDKEG